IEYADIIQNNKFKLNTIFALINATYQWKLILNGTKFDAKDKVEFQQNQNAIIHSLDNDIADSQFIATYKDKTSDQTYTHTIILSSIIWIYPTKIQIANLNANVELNCTLFVKNANPEISIVYHEKKLHPSVISQNDQKITYHYTKKNGELSDSGLYTCQAELENIKLKSYLEIFIYNKRRVTIIVSIIILQFIIIIGIIIFRTVYTRQKFQKYQTINIDEEHKEYIDIADDMEVIERDELDEQERFISLRMASQSIVQLEIPIWKSFDEQIKLFIYLEQGYTTFSPIQPQSYFTH
ncbi:hypothetical protein A3Q56_07420, partial [Intoshia linei]